MTVDISPVRTPLTAVLVAFLLAGCAYHGEYHAAGAHRSIKDDPAPSVSKPVATATARPPIEKASTRRTVDAPPARDVAPGSTTPKTAVAPAASRHASSPRPAARVDSAPPTVPAAPAAMPSAPPVVKSAAVELTPAPTAPVSIPAPAITLPSAPPAAVAAPAAPKQAPASDAALTSAQPAISAAVPPAAERLSTDLRRAAPASAPVVASAPPAAAPVMPPAVAVEPPPAKPAASAIIIQPRAPAATPKADAPAQPKVAALTDEQRVRDTIARANEYLSTKRLINARALLQDAARDDNPQLLNALAETFDPLVLREKYPNFARAAEPTRALDIYRRASERGSRSATERFKALSEYLVANPGLAKP